MAGEIISGESIQKIKIGDVEHPIDAKTLDGKKAEDFGELVKSISSSSTDKQYPSAKCMYTEIGNIENLLSQI